MPSHEPIPLRRETRAIMIPDGLEMTLPAGTPVRITQALGGSFTVASQRGNLFRIDAADAEALGEAAVAEARLAAEAAAAAGGDLEERVWEQMKTVYDPEIPVNVVDLGLVYSCEVSPPGGAGEDGRRVAIKMTLTAPGCGMGPVIANDVKQKVEALPEVSAADVEVVFDPPWSQAMMSEVAKLELGLI
jgi:probable FeS assembly SUF system protein SufT